MAESNEERDLRLMKNRKSTRLKQRKDMSRQLMFPYCGVVMQLGRFMKIFRLAVS